MSAIALMYHDVIEPGCDEASGFVSPGARSYKLPRDRFEAHLDAIEAAVGAERVGLVGAVEHAVGHREVLLTFDDGGVSAVTTVGPLLVRRGWRGHFFVTTDRISTPGFLTADDLVALHRQGHVIGTHSRSHPARISRLSTADLVNEWLESRVALSRIIGEDVWTASVPGGDYTTQVAEAASEAGVRLLFTSAPTMRVTQVGKCTVIGRYQLRRSTPARMAGALAAGRMITRWRQTLTWGVKKCARGIGGSAYTALRRRLLGSR